MNSNTNSNNLKKNIILVVDDYPLNRIKISRILEEQGYIVSMAENGEEALKMMRTKKFDLVLLDIIMPVMDGFQVLEQVRKFDDLLKIPVVVLSAVDEIEIAEKCIKMGAIAYLPKPVDAGALISQVQSLFS